MKNKNGCRAVRMTRGFVKSTACALAVAAAVTARAADYSWTDGGSYTLGDGDTLTITIAGGGSTDKVKMSSGTISSAATGSGTVEVKNCTLELTYHVGTANPFENFTGTIVIGENAVVDCQNPKGISWDESRSPFTKGPTLRFEGGEIKGFTQGNNVNSFNAVKIPEGEKGTIDSRWAASGSGCNLSLTSDISGAGKLTVIAQYRWVKLSGENAGFTGEFVYQNNYNDQYNNFTFETEKSGSASAAWTIGGQRPVNMNHEAAETLQLGAATITETSEISISKGGTLEIGGRTSGNSEINAPFSSKAFTLRKVGGDSTLTLGSKVAFVSGSTLDVDAGMLKLDGVDLSKNVTLDFAAVSTQNVTENGATVPAGTAFGKLEIAEGGSLKIPAGNWTDGGTVTLFTYNSLASGTTISKGNVIITGISANAWSATTLSDDGNGTVSATVVIPTLVWKGTGDANWTTAGAWTDAEGTASYTFADGDKVSLTAGQTIALSGEVAPGSVTVNGAVTISGSEGAKITTAAFSNSGSLTIDGNVTLDAQVRGNVCVAEDAALTFVSGQELENLRFSGTGTVTFDTSDTMQFTYANLFSSEVFTGFSGTLELAGGVTLQNTELLNNNDTRFFSNSMTLKLTNGTLTENKDSVNITYAGAIVIADGTSVDDNKLYTQKANFYLTGNISGSGKATFESGARGFHLKGDNSAFEGELKLKASRGGTNGFGPGFVGPKSASAAAAWTLTRTGTDNENRGGSLRTFYIGNNESGGAISDASNPIRFGALNVPDAACLLQVNADKNNTRGYIEVGARGDDCAIEGRFIRNNFTLTKVGVGTLTLGTGFDAVNGTDINSLTKLQNSTVAVSGGKLKVDCTDAAVSISVGANGVLAGTGKVKSVTFAEGAKIDVLPDDPDISQTYDLVTTTTEPDISAIRNAVVNGTGTNGKWRVAVRSGAEAGTWTIYAKYVKYGLTIIFH